MPINSLPGDLQQDCFSHTCIRTSTATWTVWLPSFRQGHECTLYVVAWWEKV